MFNFSMSSLCQPSSQSNRNVCSIPVQVCRFCGQFAPYTRAGYSSVHGMGGLAGSQRFSPAVVAPYGTPLNVKTPPSKNPRTLPYCVFAIAERGVDTLPGSWCAAVLMLSDASAGSPATMPIPAVAERSNASRRVSICIEDSDMNTSPLLLGQCVLAFNVEVASRNGRRCVRLATADADGVVALSNDGIAILCDYLKIAWLQIKMDFLACALFEMDALKATQSD